MVDPLSVAGLTIAVLDDLIKLGTWTAELIQDARAFDDDTRRLFNLLESDISRAQLLKALLFAEAPVYGGHTLFEQFSIEVQEQTTHLLEDSKSILQSAHELLQRRYGIRSTLSSSDGASGTLSPTFSSASTIISPTLSRTRSNTSVKTLLLWSIRDKKHVENILQKFNEQNARLEKNVKLWCLVNDLGVNPEHLKRLQEDVNSKQLGFDADATLRLVQQEAQQSTTSLLLDHKWDTLVTDFHQFSKSGLFRFFQRKSPSTGKDTTFLLETHTYEPPIWPSISRTNLDMSGLDNRTKNRVEALANLLHQPKEQIFRIPACVGWRYMPQHQAVAFVFEIGSKLEASPVSLLNLLMRREKKDGLHPGLGDKYRLAAALASCIAQLHMVCWLHESFRSENILFFPARDPYTQHEDDIVIGFESPWVLGFEFSRLDVAMTAGHGDFIPERDIYRHPKRQGHPEVTFTRIHDIYSLGVVLLEIGLWEPAIKLQKNLFAGATNESAFLIKEQLLKHADHRLEKRVGRKYRDIVVKCLNGDFGVTDDNKEDLRLQQAFRAQVVDVLERAADSV